MATLICYYSVGEGIRLDVDQLPHDGVEILDAYLDFGLGNRNGLSYGFRNNFEETNGDLLDLDFEEEKEHSFGLRMNFEETNGDRLDLDFGKEKEHSFEIGLNEETSKWHLPCISPALSSNSGNYKDSAYSRDLLDINFSPEILHSLEYRMMDEVQHENAEMSAKMIENIISHSQSLEEACSADQVQQLPHDGVEILDANLDFGLGNRNGLSYGFRNNFEETNGDLLDLEFEKENEHSFGLRMNFEGTNGDLLDSDFGKVQHENAEMSAKMIENIISHSQSLEEACSADQVQVPAKKKKNRLRSFFRRFSFLRKKHKKDELSNDNAVDEKDDVCETERVKKEKADISVTNTSKKEELKPEEKKKRKKGAKKKDKKGSQAKENTEVLQLEGPVVFKE